ncbi:hypothetical protein GCK32_001206 [Trichostrongylus colubriformis]|uniref:Uncharacterized protein n=1 Tax=Trichostrongylus colubriformis TaxID=6319 RepID=A0AAN8IJ55_TRICO
MADTQKFDAKIKPQAEEETTMVLHAITEPVSTLIHSSPTLSAITQLKELMPPIRRTLLTTVSPRPIVNAIHKSLSLTMHKAISRMWIFPRISMISRSYAICHQLNVCL